MPEIRTAPPTPAGPDDGFDHGSDPSFLAYYERESRSERTVARFRTVRDKSLALLASRGRPVEHLQVADIGCGAGTQALLWAELGHSVHGLDVNAPLVAVARRRAEEAGFSIGFDVGSATSLPYGDASMDVCLLPELLEHVPDWKACVDEAVRVLRPGGLLFLSTTNALCPVQEEFNLPLYSWYPGFLKRRCERLAVSTRPEIANYAKYPAVHWFTYYGLRRYLRPRGFECLDRFEMIDVSGLSVAPRIAVRLARGFPPARLLGHMATPATVVFAIRSERSAP